MLWATAGIGLLLLLNACAPNATQSSLEPHGSNARTIDALFWPVLWIAAGAGPKEVATRAGHTSVSFTLDRYGHLYPEADLSLRERLEAIYAASESDL